RTPRRSGRPPGTRHRLGGVTRRRGGPGRPAMSSIPCPRPYGYSIPLATPMKNLWITRRTPKNVDGKCGRECGWVPGVEEWFRLPVRGRGREMGSGDAGEALVTGCSSAEGHGNPDVAIGVGYIGEEWPVWRNGAPGLGGLSSCAPRRRRAAAPSARARPLPSAPQKCQHRRHATVHARVLAEAELREQALRVLLHRAAADEQPLRDPGVGQALTHQLQHLPLARGELVQ